MIADAHKNLNPHVSRRPELIGAAMDLPSFPSARRSRLRAVRTGAATILVVACLASGVSACSDVDDTPNTQSETSMSGADSDVASEAGSGRSDERPPNADGEIGNCADTDVSLTIPDAGVEGPLAVQSAQAIEIADGAAYTLWLTDFPVDPSAIDGLSSAPTTADGTTLSIMLTVYNAPPDPPIVRQGDVAPASTDFGILVVNALAVVAGVDFNDSTGIRGDLIVDKITDDQICVTLDYSDDQKSAVGTITADIVARLAH